MADTERPIPPTVTRIGPIVEASTCDSIGTNIQGPSLIRVPDWVPDPLGRYYLYFADHKGSYIRLAYADRVEGPWTVHRPGSLTLAESGFVTEPPAFEAHDLDRVHSRWRPEYGTDYTRAEALEDATLPHIASPDVHIDDRARRLVMYFHGLESFGRQTTRVATSVDGLTWHAGPATLGSSYFRVFEHGGRHYALVMPGLIMRAPGWLGPFEAGPRWFAPEMRHSAVLVRGDTLHVFWSRVGDDPEAILWSTIDLGPDWTRWAESAPNVVLEPELDWEGADQPCEPSRRGSVDRPVNQLRDPAIFVDDDRTYLLYSCAGESAIALATLTTPGSPAPAPR